MKVLLLVDLQNDFMPGGALGVPKGDEIIPLINTLIPQFPLVVSTQDWHPENHCSFASSHPGKKLGDIIKIGGLEQTLWPIHCVRNTKGAELVSSLDKTSISANFYKGTDPMIDSYSAFFDNARKKSTGLGEFLQSRGATDIYIAGLATDYCVLYSALDALDLGFKVHVVTNACRGINLHPGDVDKAYAAITARGGKLVLLN